MAAQEELSYICHVKYFIPELKRSIPYLTNRGKLKLHSPITAEHAFSFPEIDSDHVSLFQLSSTLSDTTLTLFTQPRKNFVRTPTSKKPH